LRGCDRNGCQNKHFAKGFCGSHYKAFLRGGDDPEIKAAKRAEDLWQFVKAELRLK
jgi:hypothetical protein